ncbi:hypothetical protein PDQ75_25115 [Bacillus cereus group sp. Bc015]|uniref:hypothetical protein n=1 Tax=Bacillus cereus group sp. Bc015 TaxID=3018123 RepID=UPI0022E24B72|nr:hypothetical protein [Bacillus cereus group sp. Bc015]MDA2738438.1 hypothetical protein [Bacillus cereus group sp. Bc015]
MKTFFEIVENKSYRELSVAEKEAIQIRQTELVLQWQDETNEIKKEEIFDELHASIKGLIKGMAYRQAEKSFSVEQEDFEGIMYLTLVETLIAFDRTLNKPFQPVFIMNVRNEIKMMYRQKGYDLHDTTLNEANRLDSPAPEDSTVTMGDVIEVEHNFTLDVEQMVVTDEILTELFGEDSKKKTIVHMSVQGFKRNEIVSAIIEEGKSPDSVAKQVNRTVSQFKAHYLNLLENNLI